MNAFAGYKSRLKTIRGELVLAKTQVLPFTELVNENEQPAERIALANLARAIAKIADVLIRVIDSLPGG